MADPAKTPLELELEDKTARARKAFEQAHGQLFDSPANATPAADHAAEPEAPLVEIPALDPLVDNSPAGAVVEEAPAEPAPDPRPARVETKESAPKEVKQAAPVEGENQPPKDNFPWAEYKKLQRELKKLEREREAAGKARESAPEPVAARVGTPESYQDISDDDPFGVKAAARAEADKLRQELNASNTERREEALRMELTQAEDRFRRQKPDYDDAIQHLVRLEQARYQRSGRAVVDGNRLMNDPRMAPVVEKVADSYVALSDPSGRVNYLERTKVAPAQMIHARELTDTEAAQVIATDLWIGARRNDIIEGAKAQGREIPEVVWEVATEMGYQPKAAAPAAVAPAPVTPANGKSVAETIRDRAKAAAAGKSLSAMSGGTPDAPAVQPIRTMRELMSLRTSDFPAYQAYVAGMNKVDPNWHRKLGA